MNRSIIILLLVLTGITLFSSCVTRRLVKKAEKLEEQGMYVDASELYYQALQRNRTHEKALIGMRRSGEFTISRMLSDFNRAYNEQRNQEAVNYYLRAKAYHERIKRVNVELNFPSFYHDYYNEVKNIFLEDKYFEGMNHLQNESFVQAEQAFREIVRVQPNYRDVAEQLNIAVFEPIYRESLALMDNGKYREAYFKLENIINNLGTYKDSHDLRRESLQKGSITIAIAPVKNSSTQRGIERNIENEIITQIQNQNNPFIKLIDQTRPTSSARSTSSAGSSVRFAAPDATLYCEIVSFNYNAGKLAEKTVPGYLKRRVKVKNQETGRDEYRTEYDKVTYKEFNMTRTINMNISFRLINDRSGHILKTGSKTLRAADNIHFARFDGNNDNLVPGYWENKSSSSDKDEIRDNRRAVQELQSLLSARDRIKTFESLATEIYTNSSAFVATEINTFVINN